MGKTVIESDHYVWDYLAMTISEREQGRINQVDDLFSRPGLIVLVMLSNILQRLHIRLEGKLYL